MQRILKKWCFILVCTAGHFSHYRFVFCLGRKWNLSKSGFDGMTMLVCDQVSILIHVMLLLYNFLGCSLIMQRIRVGGSYKYNL